MKKIPTFNIILFKPEIPPNTGNIIRLCANTGSMLHLIKPLGFNTDEKSMRRAGLDYKKKMKMKIYDSFNEFISINSLERIFLVTKFGNNRYDKLNYKIGDSFMFGSESTGISKDVYKKLSSSKKIFLPMFPDNRSLNLANVVSICIFEAWRQNNFLSS
tara:strand:- start:756 stop:1232 length:477 start_codon:yes stop_codon:yes gene_type:complete